MGLAMASPVSHQDFVVINFRIKGIDAGVKYSLYRFPKSSPTYWYSLLSNAHRVAIIDWSSFSEWIECHRHHSLWRPRLKVLLIPKKGKWPFIYLAMCTAFSSWAFSLNRRVSSFIWLSGDMIIMIQRNENVLLFVKLLSDRLAESNATIRALMR